MVLDSELLELIDIEMEMAREGIPSFKGMGLNEKFRADFDLGHENDFALGWCLGSIESGFLLHYYEKHSKFPEGEDFFKFLEILKKKVNQYQEFCNGV